MKAAIQHPFLPQELYEALYEASEQQGRSLNQTLKQALIAGLNEAKLGARIPLLGRMRPYTRVFTSLLVDKEMKDDIRKICEVENIYLADFIRWSVAVAYAPHVLK